MTEQTYIFVLDRGHVLIGRGRVSSELVHTWDLSAARTIRRWGTTKGLAELAEGPRPDTVLDATESCLVPFRSIIRLIRVEESKWQPHLISSDPSSSRRQGTSRAR